MCEPLSDIFCLIIADRLQTGQARLAKALRVLPHSLGSRHG